MKAMFEDATYDQLPENPDALKKLLLLYKHANKAMSAADEEVKWSA